MDPGGYGALTITKSITITSDGTMASVLVSGTNGIVVQAAASDVVILRNLHFDGIGAGINGIRFLAGGELHVENCEIRGFTQSGRLRARERRGRRCVDERERTRIACRGWIGVTVRNTAATGNALNGFVALAASRPVDVTISDSISSLNGAVGVYSGAFATVRIANTTITGNGIGLQAVGGSMISLGNDTLTGNGSDGAPTATISRI